MDPTVTVPNVRLVGLTDRVVSPVPERAMRCGDPGALSVIDTAPKIVPVTDGLKLTEMVQVELGATKPVVVQVPLSE